MKKVILALVASSIMAIAGNYNTGLKYLESGKESAAYEEFLKLAQNGDVDSQVMLGEMYLDGVGVKIDHQKAYEWLSKAAVKGDSEAEYLLGFMYENGLYVSQDMLEATKWYKKAALQGDVMAQFNLAMIYKEGKGNIKKDIHEAFKWLRFVEKSQKEISHVASK